MKTNFLFPNQFKKTGWIIFIPSLVLSLFWVAFEFEPTFLDLSVISFFNDEFMSTMEFVTITENNVLNEISGVLLIVSALFIAFSKENGEDEFISKIRLESLVWATYLNYGVLIFALVFVYNMSFFWVMVFNMFTTLIFFILHFNWALYKSRRELGDEK
jgi:hypothetical protein